MKSLAKPLRNAFETAIKKGRDIAQTAAEEALTYLGVREAVAPKHLSADQLAFRNQLRAHARQLGDSLHAGEQDTSRLAEEIAYEQWHRVLFTRFLVENDLLIHPDLQEPISMADCEELATEQGKDAWHLASEYASRMLPQIFRPDDPTQRIDIPVNRKHELAALVNGLGRETFLAKDALGWSYQFWQSKRKDEINASGVKIGADELAAVTQLFTEDYMVEFLLHNSLGAWWVSHHPDKPLPVEMPYLRFVEEEASNGKDGATVVRRPATGAFERWPKHLKAFTLLDPCCGSGHFPVFALMLLVPMRMQLEGLSAREAVDAVLCENLHALELDARCVEIAVFALALAAWAYPDAGGYRKLPQLNVACSGLAITQKESDWLKLASGDTLLREGMQALYRIFKEAPFLGSLINPRKALGNDLLAADFEQLAPLLDAVLAKERIQSDAESVEGVLTAKGLAQAATLLSREYNLIITNPPYLGRGNQNEVLRTFCEKNYASAKQDLANVFLERCLTSTAIGGSVQFVMPQNWLFLTSYKTQRKELLQRVRWLLLARLGSGAFDTITGEVVNVVLLTQTRLQPAANALMRGLDASGPRTVQAKAELLQRGEICAVTQDKLSANPDAIVTFEDMDSTKLFSAVAACYQGTSTGDNPRFVRCFWETGIDDEFQPFHGPCETTALFGGRELVVAWNAVNAFEGAAIRGELAWGRKGVAIGQMSALPATLYSGSLFSNSTPAILPISEDDLPAVWAFCSSPDFRECLRAINQKLSVDNGYVGKIEFDLTHWRQVAAKRYPRGLPKPYSDDPTQWIFHGSPQQATEPLQVAVARLLDYAWPSENDGAMELSDDARSHIKQSKKLARHADEDGIVCLSPVKGEKSAAERLVSLLGDSFGSAWNPGLEATLLADAGCAGLTLDSWLRNYFFAQHCKLFRDCPFIWHIWDGQKDGFAALVNYQMLDKGRLESLTYSYLGDWISQQERRVATKLDGATILLTAAKALQAKLELILKGEPPCDIFVRWKSAAEQPVGWWPDIHDGVRLNIRPFILCGDAGKKGAGILRDRPNIKWTKDRGGDVASSPWYDLGPKYGEDEGARINDHHLTLAEKNAARGGKKK